MVEALNILYSISLVTYLNDFSGYGSQPYGNSYGGHSKSYGGYGNSYGGHGNTYGGHGGSYGGYGNTYGGHGGSHGGYGNTYGGHGGSYGGYGNTYGGHGGSYGGYGNTYGGHVGAYGGYGGSYGGYGGGYSKGYGYPYYPKPYAYGHGYGGYGKKAQKFDKSHVKETLDKLGDYTDTQDDYKTESLRVKVKWDVQDGKYDYLQDRHGIQPQVHTQWGYNKPYYGNYELIHS